MAVSIHAYQDGDVEFILPRLRKIFLDEIEGHQVDFKGDDHVLTFRMDDVVIAIVGGRPVSFGVLQTWALISVDVSEAGYAFTKKLRFVIDEFLKRYHRIQMTVMDGYEPEKRWAQLLGFKKEGLMKNYSPGKKDCWMFGRTA